MRGRFLLDPFLRLNLSTLELTRPPIFGRRELSYSPAALLSARAAKPLGRYPNLAYTSPQPQAFGPGYFLFRAGSVLPCRWAQPPSDQARPWCCPCSRAYSSTSRPRQTQCNGRPLRLPSARVWRWWELVAKACAVLASSRPTQM